MRKRNLLAAAVLFGLGVAAGRLWPSPSARAQDPKADPYAKMLHVGILVKDLDAAVAKWKALGFTDIEVSPPSKGIDRVYKGEPIDVALKQAFIKGTVPPIELMEPVGDAPSAWGDYLREHGEAIHHIAFRVPDVGPELDRYRALGMEEIARGKWTEGDAHFGTFHYVQDPKGGAVIEFISRIRR